MMAETKKYEQAMFGAGCFWCVEDDFRNIEGVVDVTSGYSGGVTENPTYEEVCTGQTNHAEVVLIQFDPEVLSYKDLVYVLFSFHDPTTLNRQGPDVGTQYRSVIYYFNEEQKNIAANVIETLTKGQKFEKPIVTEVSPAGEFYRAEEYHQQYYCKIRERHPNLR
ncbi:MAG: peptide-methionine (S)-S-oxide reductase MsrA [Bdellovibrionales bacterium]|nr:peptide-methionine (S)-S-oxide reductase MsrA [Bdellovibrionales bacterium]